MKVNSSIISNKKVLDKMINSDNPLPYIYYDSFEEWFSEADYHEEDKEHWNKEDIDNINLAKIYFKWVEKGMIYAERISDDDDKWETMLNKNYKRMTSVGLGYNNVLVILTTF